MASADHKLPEILDILVAAAFEAVEYQLHDSERLMVGRWASHQQQTSSG